MQQHGLLMCLQEKFFPRAASHPGLVIYCDTCQTIVQVLSYFPTHGKHSNCIIISQFFVIIYNSLKSYAIHWTCGPKLGFLKHFNNFGDFETILKHPLVPCYIDPIYKTNHWCSTSYQGHVGFVRTQKERWEGLIPFSTCLPPSCGKKIITMEQPSLLK